MNTRSSPFKTSNEASVWRRSWDTGFAFRSMPSFAFVIAASKPLVCTFR